MEIDVAPQPSLQRPGFTTEVMPISWLSPAPPAHAEAKVEKTLKKIWGDGPGTCMVCLEECDDVIGSAWLHRQPSAAAENEKEGRMKEAGKCGISACAACLKTYFSVSGEDIASQAI